MGIRTVPALYSGCAEHFEDLCGFLLDCELDDSQLNAWLEFCRQKIIGVMMNFAAKRLLVCLPATSPSR